MKAPGNGLLKGRISMVFGVARIFTGITLLTINTHSNPFSPEILLIFKDLYRNYNPFFQYFYYYYYYYYYYCCYYYYYYYYCYYYICYNYYSNYNYTKKNATSNATLTTVSLLYLQYST